MTDSGRVHGIPAAMDATAYDLMRVDPWALCDATIAEHGKDWEAVWDWLCREYDRIRAERQDGLSPAFIERADGIARW